MSDETMNKPDEGDAMRAEYRFDYTRSGPNRFAGRVREGSLAVVLDPDVASVFDSAESVNSLLRSVIAALPDSKRASSAGDP